MVSITWIPIPRINEHETSRWTVWETECGNYRIVLSSNTLDDTPESYVPIWRKVITKEGNIVHRMWDGISCTKDGNCRGFKTLQYAMESISEFVRSTSGKSPTFHKQPAPKKQAKSKPLPFRSVFKPQPPTPSTAP